MSEKSNLHESGAENAAFAVDALGRRLRGVGDGAAVGLMLRYCVHALCCRGRWCGAGLCQGQRAEEGADEGECMHCWLFCVGGVDVADGCGDNFCIWLKECVKLDWLDFAC
jgi:hypothetical protein